MSYVSWHTYGYGICVSDIEDCIVERLQNLLSLAPEFQQEVQLWLEECEIAEATVEDYLEFDQDFRLGLATILKEVILEAEGIELVACDSYDGVDYLLYCPSYPWYQESRKHLQTEEEAETLFLKYVSVLTDDVIEVDYQSVENGG